MGKRTKLGIYFSYNENWIGGTYYIINIIEALKTIPDNDLPKIYFISENHKDLEIIKEINYPYAKYLIIGGNQKKEFLSKTLNKITGNKFKLSTNSKIVSLDFIFPYLPNQFLSKIKKRLSWIPDLQEKHLPEFFSKEELVGRDKECKRIAHYEEYVLFSSKDAFNDFSKFYPEATAHKYILNFAVTHPEYQQLNIRDLKEKYKVNEKYFFSPNQFWKHKNQIVILKALKLLKEKGQLNFQTVFSGKEHDYRNPEYFASLKTYVSENNLTNEVKFLGFIDRRDQLQLMNNAEAIIQPSLFEGWSTVVEDAKAMNQCIIASNLNVHKEQLSDSAHFFDPADAEALSEIMLKIINGKKVKYQKNYNENIQKFGRDFINIINEIIK